MHNIIKKGSSNKLKKRRLQQTNSSHINKAQTYNQAKMNNLTQFSILILTALISSLMSKAAATNQLVWLETSNNFRSTTPSSYATNSIPSQHQIQTSFSTPNQAVNISHVTYDPYHDTVYLGATNVIYQLDGSDLSEQFQSSTGPVFDNPSCGITECLGYEELMKPTQNVNKILVIDYKNKKLLSCGSTKQGACRRHQLNNIAQKEDLIPMAVAANDDNSSTYAFIAPARYAYDPSTMHNTDSNQQQLQQQQVLYVAATYTKIGQSRDLSVPAIGTRTLNEGPNLLKLYENSFVDSARIDINSHLRDYFLVNYLYGFASSNYIYFITVQKKATSRDYEELGYHTRIARICITDSSYNSYTEVDLKCMTNKKRSSAKDARYSSTSNSQQLPEEYPLLQDAILVDAGSQLLQSLVQNDQASSADFFFNNPTSGSANSDDNKVLLGIFSSAKDHTQHPGDNSALCAFSLSQIEEKFNDNIHNCYTGKMQSRNMEYIAGNVQECPKSGQGGNVVNFCLETLKINGTLPIISEASIQYTNTTLTAITATSHINSNYKNIYSDQLASEFSSFNNSKSTSGQVPPSSQHVANQLQNTVAFLGTSNGHIKMVLLNNASNGEEFEDIQVDTNPILGDLHLHSSGQQLIAATPYKVMKVPVAHNCNQYSTCRECSQSRNPYCGWCSLKRSCTTKGECVPSGPNEIHSGNGGSGNSNNQLRAGNEASSTVATNAKQQFKWISSDSSGKCIDLQSIVPDKIPLTSTGKVDLYIDRLPRLPKEHSYKCVFDKMDQTLASATPFGLSCPLPKVMHRPKIQAGKDHAIVDLAVRSSETNKDFLNGKITFFDCQLQTTCKDCLSSNWGCNWCLNENICLFNTSKCDKGLNLNRFNLTTVSSNSIQSTTINPINNLQSTQRASNLNSPSKSPSSNTINLVGQCPMFDVGQRSQEILIADGSERELTIRVKNMPQFKGNINCIVEIENDKMVLKARIEEDRVVCENATYTYATETGILNGQLAIIYSDNNIFIDRTNFSLYKCHLMGAYLNRPDCSLCQRIDSKFNCAWCSNGCNHKSKCLEADRPNSNAAVGFNSCPPPNVFANLVVGKDYQTNLLTLTESQLLEFLNPNNNKIPPIFKCLVRGNPYSPVQYKWTFIDLNHTIHSLPANGDQLNFKQFVEFRQRSMGADVYGIDFVTGLIGNYTCTATNMHGSRSASVVLQIQGRPMCKLSLGNEYLNHDNELMTNLQCSVYSVPQLMETIWFRNNEKLFIDKPNFNENILTVSQLPVMILNKNQNFMLNDLMAQLSNFKCIAKNAFGYSESCELSQNDKQILLNNLRPISGSTNPVLSMLSFPINNENQKLLPTMPNTSLQPDVSVPTKQPEDSLFHSFISNLDWLVAGACLVALSWLGLTYGVSFLRKHYNPQRKIHNTKNQSNIWRFNTLDTNNVANSSLQNQIKMYQNQTSGTIPTYQYSGSNGDSEHDIIQSSHSSHYEDFVNHQQPLLFLLQQQQQQQLVQQQQQQQQPIYNAFSSIGTMINRQQQQLKSCLSPSSSADSSAASQSNQLVRLGNSRDFSGTMVVGSSAARNGNQFHEHQLALTLANSVVPLVNGTHSSIINLDQHSQQPKQVSNQREANMAAGHRVEQTFLGGKPNYQAVNEPIYDDVIYNQMIL